MSIDFGTPLREATTSAHVKSRLLSPVVAPHFALSHRPAEVNLWRVDENGNVLWAVLARTAASLDAASDIIAMGTATAGGEPMVAAYDPVDGAELWAVTPFAPGLSGSPLVRVRNGAIYAGSPQINVPNNGVLKKLAKADGSVLHDYAPQTWTPDWEFTTPRFDVASDDDVFVMESPNKFMIRLTPGGSIEAEDIFRPAGPLGADLGDNGNVYAIGTDGFTELTVTRYDAALSSHEFLDILYKQGGTISAIDAPPGVDEVLAINGGMTPTQWDPNDPSKWWDLVRHPDWSDEWNIDASWYLESSVLNRFQPISGVALQGDDVIVAGRFAPNAGDDTPLVRVDANKTVTWQFDATSYTKAAAGFYARHFARVDATSFVLAGNAIADRSWIDGFTPPALA